MDVFSTAFLPNIAYFQHLLAAKSPVIDLAENFVKQTHRNRTFILSPNGALPLIIPIQKNDSRAVINKEISYEEDWQAKHLSAIRSSYKSSPYYEHYQEEFEELLMNKRTLLHRYNESLFDWLLKELDIPLDIKYSFIYLEHGIENDFRNVDFYSANQQEKFKEYKQVFSYKLDFTPNLSVIDLLFNKGPESLEYFIPIINIK